MDYRCTDVPGLQRFWENILTYYATTTAPGTNAAADKWSSARTLKVVDSGGTVIGSVSFDGSKDFVLQLNTSGSSHYHTLRDIVDLSQAISLSSEDGRVVGLNIIKDATAITPLAGDVSNRIATTEFVQSTIETNVVIATDEEVREALGLEPNEAENIGEDIEEEVGE